MADLPESNNWPSGIYQLETTDPVVGGPDGVSNTQAKQLADRTKWLREYAEETRSQHEKLAQGIDETAQNAIIAAVDQALTLAGVNTKSIRNITERVLNQGTAVVKNKWVIDGMVLTKSDIRALDLSQTGTVGSGVSKAYIDSAIRHIPDDDYHVTVPKNSSSSDETYYAYLHHDGNTYRVGVEQAVPEDGLQLYEILVPAGDTADDLSNVTLTDRRLIQAYNGWVVGTIQDLYIPLPYPALNAPDYDVHLTIEDADDTGEVGPAEVLDKQINGFRVRVRGSADNVRLRWTMMNPGQR